MRPESKRNQGNQFQPKWRHFHPQATLYMRNPFKEDIVFQVADEHDQPYQYRLPAEKVCELPGGAIATLGLKTVVDRMIGESKTDAIRIWEPSVRQRYEEQVIIKVKDPPQRSSDGGPQGIVDLASKDDNADEPDEAPKTKSEAAFPGAKKPAKPGASTAAKPGGRKPTDEGVAATAAASLGSSNQVIEED